MQRPDTVRACKTCGENAPHYTHSSGYVGRRCRVCDNKRRHDWCKTNKAQRAAAIKKYDSSALGRQARKQWLINNLDKNHKSKAKYQASEKGKTNQLRYNSSDYGISARKARTAVRVAIRAGRLIRPDRCESCGNTAGASRRDSIQFHHTSGYAPHNHLVGKWLCMQCHESQHAK